MGLKAKKYSEPKNPVGTVAELFAGVGGFRIGLARAGWKTVFSNQWEPSTRIQHASDVYVAQFGHDGHSNEDIATVGMIPAVDLLVGGFPCQDYSVAKSLNASRGLEGKKGVLWWEILRLVQAQKPKFIFLENVDRLLKSPSTQRGRDFAIMLKTLTESGYLVEWRVVNSAEYGFPQRRIRVFIVAQKISNKATSKNLDRHEFLVRNGVLARALPVDKSIAETSEIDLTGALDTISDQFNLGGGKSTFLNSGVAFNGTATTALLKSAFKGSLATLGDVLIPAEEVPAEYWIDDASLPAWQYLKGSKQIRRVHKGSGEEYTYAEGSMAFPDLQTNPSRTILTGEGGTTPSRFKHIIKDGNRYRRLTPVELERLNGFPDNWTKFGADGTQIGDAKRAFFMGNALVIGLIERVGKVLAQEISKA
jgi:DNA (cytosine-5)-methyltransferase 1